MAEILLIREEAERKYQEEQKRLDKEAEIILSKIPKGAWFCIFTPEGKQLSSETFAQKLQEIKLSGKSSACFLIGSSFGISRQVKEKADFQLSMGPMTFPHHLARVMVLEQVYREQFSRNLTLSRLSEAVILPLCPFRVSTCLFRSLMVDSNPVIFWSRSSI